MRNFREKSEIIRFQEIDKPKQSSSRRLISVDDTTLALIRKYITSKNRSRVVQINIVDEQMLFTRVDGTPLRLAYPNDKLDELIGKHKLHPITVHGLRHTHASLLFEAGASIKEVQEPWAILIPI